MAPPRCGVTPAEFGRWLAKFAADVAACRDNPAPFLRDFFYVFIDYLALYFRTGDVTWKHLYVGEKLKQLYEAGATPEQQQLRREEVVAADRQAIVSLFRGKLPLSDLALLDALMAEIAGIVTTRAAFPPRCSSSATACIWTWCLFSPRLCWKTRSRSTRPS